MAAKGLQGMMMRDPVFVRLCLVLGKKNLMVPTNVYIAAVVIPGLRRFES
jgi:hypothetical protein